MRKTTPRAAALTAVLAAAALAAPASAQRYNVGGDDVAIYNLAGEIEVRGSTGSQVTIEMRRGGRDGDELGVEVGEVGGRQALRVLYPSDRVVYDPPGRGGNFNASVRVRSDGTWGGGRSSWGGDRVTISSRGRGLEAHADLTVGVPAGQRIAIYVAAGRITATNVNGTIHLDTSVGSIDASGMSGRLTADTGSGSISVRGMEGDLNLDTGSGSVEVSNVNGEDVGIDTGSGRVEASAITARRIEIDTGSGGIDLARSSASQVWLDTGSGGVDAEISGRVERIEIDTGSGGVTLRLSDDVSADLEVETGSGGIDVDFPVMVTRRARDELRGTIGGGEGRITIDTGSGSVRIRRLRQ